MIRERSETIRFTRDDLERIVRYMAQSQIAGPLFVGKFGEQRVQWAPDNGIDVITTYQESSLNELPPAAPALPKRKR